jgi:hypothetical protein
LFVRKKEYERLVAEAASAAEKERLVQAMVEQIEYLRLQLGAATTSVSRSIATPDPTNFSLNSIAVEEQPWVGEEEEDLLAMRQAGVINEPEFQEALRHARQREHIIE